MNPVVGTFVGFALALLLLAGVQNWRIKGLQEKLAANAVSLVVYEEANVKNQKAVTDCKVAADKSFRNIERKRKEEQQAAERHEQRSKELEDRLAIANGRASDLATRLVGNCIAASEPEFIDFLCSGPLGCTVP